MNRPSSHNTVPNKINSRQSIGKQRSISSKTDNTENNDTRMAPRPISQTKITRTHCDLKQIPNLPNAIAIQQLYLSHNAIKSVKDKLSVFKSLRNLNLSYNLLSEPLEIVEQLKQIKLKKLGIRMNKFAYGYEDILVKGIPSLEKMEDYQLGSIQYKKQLFNMSEKVSRSFITAHITITKAISKITQAIQHHSFINVLVSHQQHKYIETIVAQMCKLLKKQAAVHLPSKRQSILRSICQCVAIFLSLREWVNPLDVDDYVEQISNYFITISQEILLRFSKRFNHSLLNSLAGSHSSMEQQQIKIQNVSKDELYRLISVFGEKYGGRRHQISIGNKGRYLQKVNTQQTVIEHPMMCYAEYKVPQTNTLCGEHGTKNQIMGRLVPETSPFTDKALFENFPIIIYERNYLQIVLQICMENIRSFVRVYDIYIPMVRKSTCKQPETKMIDHTLYLQQAEYENSDDSLDLHARKEPSPIFMEQKSYQFQNRKTIIRSRPFIFIDQQQNDSFSQNHQKQNNFQSSNRLDHKKTQKSHHFTNLDQQVSHYTFKMKEKTKEDNKAYRKTKGNQQKQGKNLAKYTMYEISLAYKVLRVLKKNKNKRERQHAKPQQKLM